MPPSLSEADTRAKLIDPALHDVGWSEDLIRREETAGAIVQIGGQTRRQNRRTDYTLRVRVESGGQLVAVALIEAKAEHLPPGHGLQQAKAYASRFNVPFIYSSNGRQFVEYDALTGLTAATRPMGEFPNPEELRRRYEDGKGFSLKSEPAKPLVQPYPRAKASGATIRTPPYGPRWRKSPRAAPGPCFLWRRAAARPLSPSTC